jgi:hypothetical protein
MIKDEFGNRRFYGVYRGIVTNNADPLNRNRVKLQVPQVLLEEETGWSWGNSSLGITDVVPPLGTSVWVMFEGGDPSFPVWSGISGTQITGVPVPVTGDLIPAADNAYVLGTSTYRWKSLQLGPGTLYIEDDTLHTQAGIGVSNGSLTINGATKIQINNMKMTSTGLSFPDGSTQTTAYVPGTIAIRTPAMGNTLTVDLSTDTYVHQHINSGNLSVTLTNPTAGRTVELLLMWGNTSGGSISLNGISGSNISNGSNGFTITKQFNSIRIYCIASNFTETFAVVSIS